MSFTFRSRLSLAEGAVVLLWTAFVLLWMLAAADTTMGMAGRYGCLLMLGAHLIEFAFVFAWWGLRAPALDHFLPTVVFGFLHVARFPFARIASDHALFVALTSFLVSHCSLLSSQPPFFLCTAAPMRRQALGTAL